MPTQADTIWMNGKVIPWAQATVHVFAHALHYGSSVFEGIRSYDTANGPVIFRGREHYERLLFSCKTMRIPSPYTVDQYMEATAQVLQANQHRNAYIRPMVFRGYNTLGVDGRNCPVEVVVASIPWDTYLGKQSLEQGVDVMVSSWRRIVSGSLSPMAKIGGQYVNSQQIVMEAKDNGFVEGIALDANGHVSEGSGENVFVVYKGAIYTPPISNGILSGITRNSVIALAQEIGHPMRDAAIPREMLYMADEVFFTGTAAEITPVRSIDRLPVGNGKPGPVTQKLQEQFFGVIEGKYADKWGWLTRVQG